MTNEAWIECECGKHHHVNLDRCPLEIKCECGCKILVEVEADGPPAEGE